MTLSSMTSPDISGAAASAVAVLPVAAVEQHGPHLPVTTDTDLVTAIARAAEARLPDVLALCPTLPYGSSHHHLGFAGTLSVRAELWTEVVCDLLRSLVSSGFRKVVVLNGHGGNITPVRQALAILSREVDPAVQIVLATYWELAPKIFGGAAPMQSPALSHACEYETSMMLQVSPSGVRMEQAAAAGRPPSNGYIPWHDDEPYRGITLFCRTEFLSSNGCCGHPELATPEKGRYLVDAAVDAFTTFVQQFASWPTLKDLRHA